MTASKLEINRPLTGILALVSLVSGGFLFLVLHRNDQVSATLIRTGLVLGALWLALPTKTRPAAWENISWTGVIAFFVVIIVFVTSRLRWWAMPLVIALGLGLYFSRRYFGRR